MRKIYLIFGLIVVGFISACSSGGNSSSKGILAGVEECAAYYFSLWIEEEDYKYMPKDAIDLYKKNLEDFLMTKIGTEIPTTVTESSGINLESPFVIEEVNCGVGRPIITPGVHFRAKASNTGQKVGYIGRNSQGIPVFAGTEEPENGEIDIYFFFDNSGDDDYIYLVHKTLGSFVSIELMSEEELNNHIITSYSNWGDLSLVRKGVAKIVLDRKLSEIPECLPGLYNQREYTQRVEEGPEDDFTIKEMILKQDGKQVAVVTYSDTEKITRIKITSPEMFYMDNHYTSNYHLSTALTVHIASDPMLILHGHRAKKVIEYDPETYLEVPAVAMGIARFQGIEVKNWQPNDNQLFEDADIVPNSHFTEITIQNR